MNALEPEDLVELVAWIDQAPVDEVDAVLIDLLIAPYPTRASQVN